LAAPPETPPPPSTPVSNGGTAVTSPLVRRMIAEEGLDPSAIRGTGEGGRITRRDVVEATRGRAPTVPSPSAPAAPTAPAPAAAPAAGPAPAPAPVARASGDEVVPFDNIRRRTAEHMVRSKA